MLTERSIINFLIWTGGLIAGPYLATSAISGNFNPLYWLLGVTIIALIFGVWRDTICILPYVATYCSGRFNMLPMKPSPTDLAVLALIAYFVIAYLALRRKRVPTGPLAFFIPIMTMALILLYNEHDFGLRGMGTGREGGRKAYYIVIAAFAYICGIGVDKPSIRALTLTPAFCAIGSTLFALPYVITTYVPAFAPYIYLISDNVNVAAYDATVLNTDDMVRNQGQALLGWNIFACLMVYFPFTTWLRPTRWWILPIAVACFGFVVLSGFRSILVEFLLLIGILAWCYVSWRALSLVCAFALGVAFLVVLQSSHLVQLPPAAQRTLAFLPGDWDSQITDNTEASNNFRRNIINVYIHEYASVHPWLGNGLSYDSAEFDEFTYLSLTRDNSDGYFQSKQFIIAKMFHTGWLSVYDAVGAIGSLCFLSLFLTLIIRTGRSVLPSSVSRSSTLFPLKAWIFASLLESFISFFTLFGDVAATFPILCYTSIVWVHLTRIEKGIEKPANARSVQFDTGRAGLPVPA